jgi:hypothetical protein
MKSLRLGGIYFGSSSPFFFSWKGTPPLINSSDKKEGGEAFFAIFDHMEH